MRDLIIIGVYLVLLIPMACMFAQALTRIDERLRSTDRALMGTFCGIFWPIFLPAMLVLFVVQWSVWRRRMRSW